MFCRSQLRVARIHTQRPGKNSGSELHESIKAFKLSTFKAFRDYLLLQLAIHVVFVGDEIALERLSVSLSHHPTNDAYSCITAQLTGVGKTEFEAAIRLNHYNNSYFEKKEEADSINIILLTWTKGDI
jgi:hypothetical protein